MNIQVYWFYEGTMTVAFYDFLENVSSDYSIEDYKREYAINNGADELEGYRIEFRIIE